MDDLEHRPLRRPADVALDLLAMGRPRDYVARYLLTASLVEAAVTYELDHALPPLPMHTAN
jgi:hypothetical protein